MKFTTYYLLIVSIILITGCAGQKNIRMMEVTGYCGCAKCCGWERGSWKYLKLDFWKRYVTTGKNKGKPYTGLTAGGTKPNMPVPGLFSKDSFMHPWMIPVRIIFFPWLFIPQDGTIAADTKFYPFNTRVYIPSYGYGIVKDRGSAIKGKNRLDLFFNSHQKALNWGRKKIYVQIIK